MLGPHFGSNLEADLTNKCFLWWLEGLVFLFSLITFYNLVLIIVLVVFKLS